MTSLAIVVEGPTETEFVDKVLAPHLRERGVCPFPNSLDGHVFVARLASRIAGWLRPPGSDFVTSLVDFYGFRDKQSGETVGELQDRITVHIADEIRRSSPQGYEPCRVIPYVQQHEFEALLFSDVNAVAAVLPRISQGSVAALRGVRCRYPTPEDINDDPDTAPSKQIERVIRGYNKRRHGYLVAEEIGLDKIRAECPRFNDWVTRLEALANPPASS